MAGDDAALPQVTIDVHAEFGTVKHPVKQPAQQRQRAPTLSRNEKRRTDARFFFNTIIESHYRDQSQEYSDVASLFITWEANDLLLHEKNNEVDQLRSIFDRDLGYKNDAFQIPPEKPETALNAKVAEFVHQHDDKNALLVLYYAGHGFVSEDEESGLKIAAIEEGNGKYGDPQAFFPDVMRLLHVAHGDVLLIIDCCYAARAFSRQRHGKRKFELLASSLSLAPAPGQPQSFTAALIKVLRRLLKEPEYKNGVSTSILYRELYHCEELTKFKPLLFDQSQFDYGKIWLRPRIKSSTAVNTPMPGSDTTLDLRLHLSLTKKELMDEKRVGLTMNRLARALQYLPDVQLIDFLELNAGDTEVRMFLQASRRLTTVKKVIRILKERVKDRRRRKLEMEAQDPKRPLPRPPSFAEHLLKPDISATQDWSDGVAQFSDGKTIAVKPIIEEDTSRPQPHVHERRRTFWIPHIVYLTYILDFTGIWITVARLFGAQNDEKSEAVHRQDVKALQRPMYSSDETHLAREWKRRRFKRLLPRERMFWLCLVMGMLWYRREICNV